MTNVQAENGLSTFCVYVKKESVCMPCDKLSELTNEGEMPMDEIYVHLSALTIDEIMGRGASVPEK
ncbi:Hypothetical protein GbCGDNIH6_8108 [Granulibacter bethesdensis]|nr:Hypothetical protein GbCGDNIH6_8108 [Granulibacter bethesdensis]